ncbi:cation-transporting P-type ATPase [Burkholderia sp. PAMC 26561]|uniref:cation-transporting P-type ATPase n=1 Tax=Burkholderia sp. PAMC 26561 TaxID=1795043 RepID=UPI001F1BB68B|nr:cation-transporting P-type ATPase [Burkholderia sp. PAMC 26561]
MTVSSPGPADDSITLSVPQAGAPKLKTTGAAGLSTAEAALRLTQNGANAVADITPHPLWRAVRKLWAPVPWMLEAAIVLQLGLGDYVGAGIVLLLLLFNAGLGLFQEGQAQATVDALKSRLALIAAVRRDGQWTTVPRRLR